MNFNSTRYFLKKSTHCVFFAILLLLFSGFFYSVNAQNGYIYVQAKALDERSSINFPFSISGGTTVIPNFSLNDKEEQIALQDIGASQGGRLWAVGINNILYYRDLDSSGWVETNVTDAYKVDGGPGNSCYYLRTTNDPYYFDGTTSTLLGNWDAFGDYPAVDIGSAWNNQPYIITDEGTIWQYSGSGTTWLRVGIDADNKYIDGDPSNGNAVVVKTDNSVWAITSTGIGSNLGSPENTSTANDIAVTSDGSIFGSFAATNFADNNYAFKWISGTAWTDEEITSREYVTGSMTAGIGGQVWGAHGDGSTSLGNQNLFTRTYDGTATLWLNDERVRTSVIGNSIMIAVEPGTYTLTELVPAGWDLQHINVYDPSDNSSAGLTANRATVVVAADETVTALFENGLVRPFAMTNSCATAYLENFGTGPEDSYGLELTGQTSYHYQTTNNTLANNYKVIGNADMLFGGAAGLTDHTNGDGEGRMMAVDANNEKDAFFRRRFIGITPGATYNFSAWIANINAGATIQPNVTFEVIDPTTYAVLQTLNTGDIIADAVWTKYGITFLANTTSFDLVIRNNGFGGTGNDLVIDDISFSMEPVPAPITTVTNTSCNTLGAITVTFPLGSAYEYSLDSFATGPHASPAFDSLTAGVYTVSVRFVGTVDCFRTKTDLVGATVCGNIWNDGNGNATNNNEEAIKSGVWINVVDTATHVVVQSAQVDVSGNYSVTGLLPNTSYQIIITNADQTGNTNLIAAALPNGFAATGTNLNGVANTTDTTGIIMVNSGINGITDQNLGIESLPITDSIIQSIAYPAGGIINLGMITTSVSGNDAEDGTLGNATTFMITDLPVNAIMYYNGIEVTAGQQITGFNPLLVSFTTITVGSASVVFNYAFIDSALQKDPTPASYTINWLGVLPVMLKSFTATVKDCNSVILSWNVANAVNFARFEIEQSTNGIDFKTLGTVRYNLAVADYNFSENVFTNGVYQYRLRMVDFDGKSKYSPVALLRLDCSRQRLVTAYPNPAKDKVIVKGLNTGEQITMYNAAGQNVKSSKAVSSQLSMDITTLVNGTYYIIVTGSAGEQICELTISKIDN